MKDRFIVRVIAIVGCFLTACTGSAKPLKVLMIGNSFSICVLRHLPNAAKAMGCDLRLTSAYIGGCSLERHWENVTKASDPNFKPYLVGTSPEEKNVEGPRKVLFQSKANVTDLLRADQWDIVTIQQASHFSWDPETYQPYANQLITKIKELAPTAKIVVQQTWAYCNADPRIGTISKKPSWGFDQQGMYDRLAANYTKLAKDHNLRVIPTGYAVQLYRKQLPVTFKPATAAELKAMKSPALPDMGGEVVGKYYWRTISHGKPNQGDVIGCDTIHLNPAGEYLQACVWLSFLFDVDVTKLTYSPKVAGPNAALMRKCAQEAVSTFKY